jgi:hypothetical protein
MLCSDPYVSSLPAQSVLSAMIAEERQSLSAPTTDEAIAAEQREVLGDSRPTNEFDRLLDQITDPSLTLPALSPDSASIGWLEQWVKQSPTRMPSSMELQCLRGLTNLPVASITEWLAQNFTGCLSEEEMPHVGNPSPEQLNTSPSTQQPPIPPSTSQSRYSTSLPCSSRPCHPTPASHFPSHSSQKSSDHQSPSQTLIYHCTTHCGFTTPRRSDWSRHERKRFEEWLCPITSCGTSLTRKEKLRDHLRVVHGRLAPAMRQLESCRHERDEGVTKTCPFCAQQFETWNIWLLHVGDHFENQSEARIDLMNRHLIPPETAD